MVSILDGVLGLTGCPPSKPPARRPGSGRPFSAAVIINILARKRIRSRPPSFPPDALRLTHEPVADCARYDSLRRAS
jgi:hypothetical protein